MLIMSLAILHTVAHLITCPLQAAVQGAQSAAVEPHEAILQEWIWEVSERKYLQKIFAALFQHFSTVAGWRSPSTSSTASSTRATRSSSTQTSWRRPRPRPRPRPAAQTPRSRRYETLGDVRHETLQWRYEMWDAAVTLWDVRRCSDVMRCETLQWRYEMWDASGWGREHDVWWPMVVSPVRTRVTCHGRKWRIVAGQHSTYRLALSGHSRWCWNKLYWKVDKW